MWGKRRVHSSDAIKCRGTINSYGGISGVHFLITTVTWKNLWCQIAYTRLNIDGKIYGAKSHVAD